MALQSSNSANTGMGARLPPDAEEIARRASVAAGMLRSCELCERRCRVDRTKGERAPCGLGVQTSCFKRHVSYAEEAMLLPSYMVYLAACNFRCRFCVQAPACFDANAGLPLDATAAAADFRRVVDQGAASINLLGGEPSLHLHTILDIAAAAGNQPLPLVLNTNMYMTPQVIDLLEGVISLYIADYKFGNDTCAARLASIPDYTRITTRNLRHAAATTPVIIRHLVMPGHIDCCLRPVVRWVAEQMPTTPFTLMTSYVPGWLAESSLAASELSRPLSRAEAVLAESIVKEAGLCTSE
ncbi:MAG: radical SAM protein [Planctomycetota bacterium]|nr:radical SAM protein [Planctomycetota bacterium]